MQIISSAAADPEHVDFLTPVLPRIPLFATLSESEIRTLLYFIQVVKFDAGEPVIRRGDSGETFFVIHEGSVRVSSGGLLGGKELSTMGPGDFFGELSVLLDQPRSADVAALEDTWCYMLDRDSLLRLIERHPEIGERIKSAARERFDGPS